MTEKWKWKNPRFQASIMEAGGQGNKQCHKFRVAGKRLRNVSGMEAHGSRGEGSHTVDTIVTVSRE